MCGRVNASSPSHVNTLSRRRPLASSRAMEISVWFDLRYCFATEPEKLGATPRKNHGLDPSKTQENRMV